MSEQVYPSHFTELPDSIRNMLLGSSEFKQLNPAQQQLVVNLLRGVSSASSQLNFPPELQAKLEDMGLKLDSAHRREG